ncbi:MAG: exo-beta-N-acetylmuramidase NamZ domain-containing protein [Pyrinomonadaceae bacterium]
MQIGSLKYVFSNWKFLALIGVYLCLSAVDSSSQGLPLAGPQTVGMNASKLDQIEQLVNKDIADKKLPGAVVVVGHKGKIVYRRAFGNRSVVPNVEKMTVDTIFDVASLTKPVATATSIMILVERGEIRLNDTVGKFITDIDDPEAKKITIQQLLTHTSGYRPDFDLGEKWTGRDGMLAALKKEKLRDPPGTRFVYSDIGFIVLGELVERITGKGENDFVNANLFDKLGVQDSAFWRRLQVLYSSGGDAPRSDDHSKRFAPTENIRGQNNYLGAKFEGDDKAGDAMLRGQVHDPTSFRMGGVAGHAGLFSTADDLARYCQMLLNGGILDGKRILSAQTVSRMTTPYVVAKDGATRALGWDMNTSFSSNRGELFPLGSFGHTGFTGTSIWIDRVSQTFYVFLSNRVHPDGKGDVTPLRARVGTVVASAIEDTPIEKWKEAEANYNSSVAAQIPKFRNQVEAASSQIVSLPTNKPIMMPGLMPGVAASQVLNGIDVLERSNFKELSGKRVGLVTNHTGKNLAGKPTIDVLHEATNVKLVSLFAPEHGIRGELDQERIDDTKDEKTGLPVYSLYGETRRPKPEQLKDLDAIVYDIQDIGARFYTSTATLKNVLEEAAKLNVPVYILDRPNPINGLVVEGPLAEEDKISFIAAHTTPVRYGLTIGELGMMMNAERKIGAKLNVIKMENWSRSMWFDETGQTWVNPSPNMRSLTEATLYPGIGLLETTNLSVGRGTDTPFEVIGAPWLDGQKLAKYLNQRNVRGVRFVPVRYKPDSSVFKGESVGGVNIIITDRNSFESVRAGLEIAAALRKLYPNDWQVNRYLRLLVNQDSLDRLSKGEAPEQIEASWSDGIETFKARRLHFLLYK